MPRGGIRQGAGRPKGAKDRSTIEHRATLEELARAHTQDALEALVNIAKSGQSESARVAAATAILDRGYGKSKQSIEHTGTVSLYEMVIQAVGEDSRPEHGAQETTH